MAAITAVEVMYVDRRPYLMVNGMTKMQPTARPATLQARPIFNWSKENPSSTVSCGQKIVCTMMLEGSGQRPTGRYGRRNIRGEHDDGQGTHEAKVDGFAKERPVLYHLLASGSPAYREGNGGGTIMFPGAHTSGSFGSLVGVGTRTNEVASVIFLVSPSKQPSIGYEGITNRTPEGHCLEAWTPPRRMTAQRTFWLDGFSYHRERASCCEELVGGDKD